MDANRLVSTLMSIGFTQNMAKIYVALLNAPPLSGYRVARKSGVTRPRTYDALKKLVDGGFVRIIYGSPILYVCEDIRDIVNTQREAEELKIERASIALKNEGYSSTVLDSLRTINGYQAIIARLAAEIEKAEEKINLLVYEEEHQLLLPLLQKADARGVRIHIVVAADEIPLYVFAYASEQTQRFGCDTFADSVFVNCLELFHKGEGNRLLLAALDGKVGLCGMFSKGDIHTAVLTNNPTYADFISGFGINYFVKRDYNNRVERDGFVPFREGETFHLREKMIKSYRERDTAE